MILISCVVDLSVDHKSHPPVCPCVLCQVFALYWYCVLVTHIPYVCMSTFPKADLRTEKFFTSASIDMDNTVSVHTSSASNSHMAGFCMQALCRGVAGLGPVFPCTVLH